MSGGGGPDQQYVAFLYLTFVLIIVHFGGHAIEDVLLFQAGVNIIKVPFDLFIAFLNATIGATSAIGGIALLIFFGLILVPFLIKVLGEGLTDFATVCVIIALVIGFWVI